LAGTWLADVLAGTWLAGVLAFTWLAGVLSLTLLRLTEVGVILSDAARLSGLEFFTVGDVCMAAGFPSFWAIFSRRAAETERVCGGKLCSNGRCQRMWVLPCEDTEENEDDLLMIILRRSKIKRSKNMNSFRSSVQNASISFLICTGYQLCKVDLVSKRTSFNCR
jgi:hypothetical protein